MKRIAVLVLLAVAPAAHAKGFEAAEICGSAGCIAVPGEDGQKLGQGGPWAAGGPVRPEPYYRIRYTLPPEAGIRSYTARYLPKANLLRTSFGRWVKPRAEFQRIVNKWTGGRLVPFGRVAAKRAVPVSRSGESDGVAWLVALAMVAAGVVAAAVLREPRLRDAPARR